MEMWEMERHAIHKAGQEEELHKQSHPPEPDVDVCACPKCRSVWVERKWIAANYGWWALGLVKCGVCNYYIIGATKGDAIQLWNEEYRAACAEKGE